jgi:hypothetical protein
LLRPLFRPKGLGNSKTRVERGNRLFELRRPALSVPERSNSWGVQLAMYYKRDVTTQRAHNEEGRGKEETWVQSRSQDVNFGQS